MLFDATKRFRQAGRAKTMLAHARSRDVSHAQEKYGALQRGCGWIEPLLKVWPVFIHYFITLGRFFRIIWDQMGNARSAGFHR